MRENDTINVLSLFFFSSPDYSWMRSYQDNDAYADLMYAFYPRIPYSHIEKAFRQNNNNYYYSWKEIPDDMNINGGIVKRTHREREREEEEEGCSCENREMEMDVYHPHRM